MKEIQYHVEIYEPGSSDDLIVLFQSSTPFLAISPGDLINQRVWETDIEFHMTLQVTSVEHILWEVDTHIGHKLCVYTRKVDDTAETRFP